MNEDTYRISKIEEIEKSWFAGVKSVGICGATSTPQWLMEEVAEWIKTNFRLRTFPFLIEFFPLLLEK